MRNKSQIYNHQLFTYIFLEYRGIFELIFFCILENSAMPLHKTCLSSREIRICIMCVRKRNPTCDTEPTHENFFQGPNNGIKAIIVYITAVTATNKRLLSVMTNETYLTKEISSSTPSSAAAAPVNSASIGDESSILIAV